MRTFADLRDRLAKTGRFNAISVPHDVMAGVAITAFLVPQGIAYAQLAGLPPIVGLYATLVPLIVYALVGPSRILVLGPDSALAPLVAAVVIPLAGSDIGERTALAGLLAILVGAFLLAGAAARLGFLTDLLSTPVRLGYLSGLAAIVTVENLPQALGFQADGGNFIEDARSVIEGLDQADAASLALSLFAAAVVFGGRRVSSVIPGVFIAVVVATVTARVFDLGVDVIGAVPGGLPRPELPSLSTRDVGTLAVSAAAIALLAFADTSILSRSYSTRLLQRVDQNNELAALGLANLAAGLLQGFPVSGSASRTPVAEAAGARSQLTGLVAAAAIGALLVAGTSLLEDIPRAVLAAVVLSAVLHLADLRSLRWLFVVNKTDFALAVAAFVGVLAFGILPGVGIAVALSVLGLLERTWHPYIAVLGRVMGMKGYHDTDRHPEAKLVPGLVLLRFDAPLFFANAEIFHDAVLTALAEVEHPQRLVIAAEPITDIDSTAAEVLAKLPDELERRGISLAFAEMKGPVKDHMRRYGIYDRIGDAYFHPTIGEAVRSYVNDYDIDWHDWEEDEEEVLSGS